MNNRKRIPGQKEISVPFFILLMGRKGFRCGEMSPKRFPKRIVSYQVQKESFDVSRA